MARPRKADYEQVDSVPDGLRWKPAPGPRAGSGSGPPRKPPSPDERKNKRRERERRTPEQATTTLFSFANTYMLVRMRATGAVTYYRLKDMPEKSPAEKIDAEPTKKEQVRFRVGAQCWFVDTGGRWFLCEVVERTGHDRATFGEPGRIVIKSVTGWDADRKAPWEYGDLLEFPDKPNNPLFMRLRPLKARYQ